MDSKLAASERAGFRERLKTSLLAAGIAPKPSTFAREFNCRADGATVTVHAARKWLVGESFPTQERLHVLSRWLHVSPQWLRYGEGEEQYPVAANESGFIPHHEILMLGDFRRLDERSRAVVRDLISSLLKHHALRK
jgi:hypothetical protein